jgi:RNA polymerase-interacting CarD/CdnL/TRCF family regulator
MPTSTLLGTTPGSESRFQIGDQVVHANKPEWGKGTVVSAGAAEHEGKKCQRLSVRFSRAGLKTVMTGVAPIERAGDIAEVLRPKDDGHHDPLPIASAGHKELIKIMSGIPERARDPFATPAQRLRATLDLYKFEGGGGGLVDWAAAQSGLADPLSRFNRHELEEYYRMFEKNLHKHLSQVVRDANNVPASELVSIAKSAPPAAQRALQKLHRPR